MSPKALLHRAGHLFPDSLNANSTENFKTLWLGFMGMHKLGCLKRRREG